MHSYTRPEPQPKMKTYRSEKYLNFIRSKPCVICSRKSVAAHVRKQYWGASTAQKPHDYACISLCDGFYMPHHKELDSIGMEAFEEKYNIDIKRIIIDNLIEYIGREK